MTWRIWVCLVLSVVLAAAALQLFGVSLWTVLFALITLACPAVMVWGYVTGLRPLPVPVGPVPETRGVTLDWLAPYYDGVCRLVGIGRSFRDRTLALAGLRPGERVLDIGCGTGVLTRRAAEIAGPSASVWGIDPTADMIRIARGRAAAEASTARFKPAAIESLPFEADSFDLVLISFVLHHLPLDLKRSGLREVHRVLRRGGRLLVVDLDRASNRPLRLIQRLVLRHAFMAEHREGLTADLVRQADFVNVTTVGAWRGLLGFWIAEKPG